MLINLAEMYRHLCDKKEWNCFKKEDERTIMGGN